MIQDRPGVFPTATNNPIGGTLNTFNLADGTSFSSAQGNGAFRTSGQTLLVPVSLFPTQSQRWKLQAVSILTNITLILAEDASSRGQPLYGKLGKIIAGIVPSSAISSRPFNFGTTGAFLPLPVDSTLTTSLFDPATDPLPPQSVAGTGIYNLAFQAAVINPPFSRDLVPGEPTGVGIWMLPSVYGSNSGTNGFGLMGLGIYNAQFNIIYDDGH